MECDSGSELPVRPEDPPPEGGGEENNASTSMTNSTISTAASPATTLPTLPLLPLAARLHKLSCDTASEEPKAGPSNSAAQFDLEVFDSGSSCSNEECWEGDGKGGKVRVPEVKGVDLETEGEAVRGKLGEPEECSSECETEAEEMEVGDAEDEGPVVGEDDEEVDEEAHNVLLPAETIDRKESVELWKSRNETDVIVADHDVFGTDGNDGDSLDSLLRVEPGESFREGGSRLTFGHSSVIPGILEDQDDSTMSSEPLCESLPSKLLCLDEGEEGGVGRPKRKSGSLTELGHASLPLKKQRPECRLTPVVCHGLETPDSAGLTDSVMFCDSHTAPWGWR